MALPTALRRCLTCAKYAAGGVFAASMTSAWYYRPTPSTSTGQQQRNDNTIMATTTDSRRAKEVFCSPQASPPYHRDNVPLLLEWARRISIGVTTIAIRILMNTYGKYEIDDDEHYANFLETVLKGNDRVGSGENQGLITVSNHRSLFDDPGVVSCLLPLPIAIQPKHNRWAICSQEYCYNDALPGIIKGYIGAGQVLPICRGGGINQRLLLDFGKHLACGEWCHVFPEGGVWQWDELGGRRKIPPNATMQLSSDFGSDGGSSSDDRDELKIIPTATLQQKALPPSPDGKLKWGVGKLIAHAPITPKVIPFAHHGMERLLPQDENTGKTKLRDNLLDSMLPAIFGGEPNDKLHIRVKFGEEIEFDDLIQEHEMKHGKLWKYHGKEVNEQQRQHETTWESSREERALYSKIVRRIEGRLDVLTREVCSRDDGR